MTTDTTIVVRHATPTMGKARGHIGDSGPARVVIDDTLRKRTYVEFYNPQRYLDFVHAAAHSLGREDTIALATSLLSVMTTEDRTQAIARAVSTYHTPRVEIAS